jgi:ribosome production factor 2
MTDKSLLLTSSIKKQAKSARTKRILEDREPQVFENPKICTFLRGKNTSQTVNKVLQDLYRLKKPNAILLSKNNDILPFEGAAPLEFLSSKNDSSLFAMVSHSKKRPNNLVIGRMFDHALLDMMEFSVLSHQALEEFPGEKCHLGSKPLMVFLGEQFHLNGQGEDVHSKLANLFVDFFGGERIDLLNLSGMEHVISVAVEPETEIIHLRVYSIRMEKSGETSPRIELQEMGPFLDLKLLRTKFSSEEMRKASLKRPKEAQPKKTKNVEKDSIGDVLGRVYVDQQDLSTLQTRKVKALKKDKPAKKTSQSVDESETEQD